MVHINNITKSEKGKHLNYEKRIKIEALSKAGLKSEAMAAQIGCSGRTVRRELAKGRTGLPYYTTRIEYSADIGQQKHDLNRSNTPLCLQGAEFANDCNLQRER